ncbi:MAG: phosphate signaling complex protein PhoU [Deltaproteobacteria bacterium]|nr:phosphate signaling complex protein PhoU [Deltaproteobacteria bacterium]
MRMRLQRDIDGLTSGIISLGALVEERLRMAVKAIECRDMGLADQVIEGDIEIDRQEVDIEEEGLKILALHQPVADQLRYIIAIVKMNNDLERIGDLAVNVAERAKLLGEASAVQMPFDFFTMCEKVQEMLQKSLDSLVNMNADLAYDICAEDDDVDMMKSMMQEQFLDKARRDPENLEPLVHLLIVSRHLERIADHATNIAEDVIYMVTGRIHRHKGARP